MCQHISKSKIIPVTHSFSTSLLRRNLADLESYHEKIRGSTPSMDQTDSEYLLEDKVTNVKVRELTGMPTLEHIIRERRIRWAGHIWRMPNDALARTALNWIPAGCKRKPGWPHMDWIQTVKQDIARADVKWDDAPQLATDRAAWRTLTAQCIDGAGGSKV